ncbi:MAG TPA: L,D-transpeptidase [Aequorivita sp.]|nr:L,D-transpeptidase [Aequorivita sp.]
MKNIILFVLTFTIISCGNSHKSNVVDEKSTNIIEVADSSKQEKLVPIELTVNKDVPIRSYFKWMDSIVEKHNQSHNYPIDEYIIVHHNKWIMDTLANTDYYYLMDKGIFNEDSQSLLALKKDQVLVVPDSLETQNLRTQLANTYLELNIPEFRLRIFQDDKEIYKFPVRVGKVGKKYMAMAKGTVDMRTKTGVGEIIRVNKEPVLANPVDNRKYEMTNRDDGKRTTLPAIPWLEPSIDGRSVGQLIHPTTNLETLEKASSNGCIGLRESHAWIVYYYAPLGTKVVSKYKLTGKNDLGETVELEDIYPGFGNKK